MTGVSEQDLRGRLALGCRVLAMEGLGDINLGHVSVRAPGEDRFWMKGSGAGLEEIGVEDLVLLDYEGNKLQGERRRHKEYPLHAEVFRIRPDVGAVVHVHPLHSTTFSALDEPLRPITHEGALFSPPIPRYTELTDLILTREEGESVAKCLADRNAVLMRNHGILVVGSTVEEACMQSIFLDRATQAQLLLVSRKDFDWSSDQDCAGKRKNIYSPDMMGGFWEYYVRKLSRQERLAGLG